MQDGQNKIILALMLGAFLSICVAVVIVVHKRQDTRRFQTLDLFQEHASAER